MLNMSGSTPIVSFKHNHVQYWAKPDTVLQDPVFYVPLAALEAPGRPSIQKQKDQQDVGYWTGSITSGNSAVDMVAHTKGPLAGLVKLQMGGSDLEWFAEDERLLGNHPKDPYKRIEILPSIREIRVEVNGVAVAQSTNSMFLYETMLRTRYYLPATSVKDWAMLSKSETTTFCPYKGQASYYHLQIGHTVIQDAVWYYVYPTHESAAIQGLLCFYNEKVDIFVDGQRDRE